MSDTYADVQAAILKALESGTAPWRKPWVSIPARNAFTDRPYRGINTLLLSDPPTSDPRWATFHQVREHGGRVIEGSRGTRIYFYKVRSVPDTREGREGKTRTVPYLNAFTVFHRSMIEGVDLPDIMPPAGDPIATAESIVAGYEDKPSITENGSDRAYYRPSTDSIHLPDARTFDTRDSWYETLFHELGHSTGHPKRLDRPGMGEERFGSERYGKEELVAEMSAGFLLAEAGIAATAIDNVAAYIGSWIEAIKGDKRLAVQAAGAAQKAADYIMGKSTREITE